MPVLQQAFAIITKQNKSRQVYPTETSVKPTPIVKLKLPANSKPVMTKGSTIL